MPIITITGELDEEAINALPSLEHNDNITITLTANVDGKVTTEAGTIESYIIGQAGAEFSVDNITVN